MAPLTWKNIDAPEFSSAAAQLFSNSGQNIADALSGIGGAMSGVREAQRNERSAAAIPMLAQIANEQGAGAAVDWATKNIRAEDMTPGLQEALLGANTKGLALDVDRAGMFRANAENTRTQTTHDRDIARENQLASMTKGLAESQERGLYGTDPGLGGGQPPAGRAPYNEETLLAMNIAAEAGGEGAEGKRAVAAVTLNRANDGRYGDGVGGVISKRGQFSWTNSMTGYAGGAGGIPVDQINVTDEDRQIAREYLAAHQSGEGYYDPTNGATHYYNPNAAAPAWGGKGGGWTSIGNHTFGTPDGPMQSNGNPYRVSDAIPSEGNVLLPSDIAPLVTADYGYARTGKADREADLASAQSKESLMIAQEAAQAAANPADIIPSIMNRNDLAPEVKKGAIAEVVGMDVEAQRKLPTLTASGVPEPVAQDVITAEKSITESQAVHQYETASDESTRVYKNFTESFSSGDPVSRVAEVFQLGNDTNATGYISDYINDVIELMRQPDGSSISPNMAATLLVESAERGGWLPGTRLDGDWDSVVPDPQTAADLGKALKLDSADGIRQIQRKISVRDDKQKRIEDLGSQMTVLQQEIQYMASRGQDVGPKVKLLQQISQQIFVLAPGKASVPDKTSKTSVVDVPVAEQGLMDLLGTPTGN